MRKFLRQASSFIAPVLVCIVFPYILIAQRQARTGFLSSLPWDWRSLEGSSASWERYSRRSPFG